MSCRKVRLGDVCEVRAGRDYKDVQSDDGAFPIYGTGGIMGRATEARCPANSVVVGRKGTLDNPMLIREPFWNIDTCFGVIPSEELDAEYLWRFCQKFDFYSLVPASGRPSTTSDAIKGIQLPLPDLDEQRRIAASVEKAMKRVDAIERQFEKLRETAMLSRNSVLAEAFSAIDCDAIRLDVVCEISRGKSKHRPRNDPRLFGGEYPFIQTGDIRAAQGEVISSCDQYYSDFGLRQSRLWPAGTLCVTIAANIGESAILGFDACFPDSVVGLLPKDGRLLRDYLNAFMIYSKPRLERRAAGTAQKNANIKMLSEMEIPLPDRQEQHRVVELITSTKSRSDKIMSLATRGLTNCARMRKAILAEAFAV